MDKQHFAVHFRHKHEIFLFSETSKKALGPTQPHIQWESGPLSQEIKQSECEADTSFPQIAEVKNA
jgi:hypothetical protein